MPLGIGDAEEVLSITTADGDFLVLGMTGHEHLGRMFEYTVELAGGLQMFTNEPKKVDLHDLTGTVATVKMAAKEDERFFNGYVTRFSRGEKRGRYETFTMTLQPWLWFLTRTKTSRVFQEKDVKTIITEVFADYAGVQTEWKITDANYPKLDYCVQYNETDFDFVSRLMEDVGIYYFFTHEDKHHKMILIDSMAKHESRGDTSAINWANAMQSGATITTWTVQEEARSVKAVVTEYDYLAPTTAIKGEKDAPKPPEKLGKMEWFEHPALVVQNSVKPDPVDAATPATNRATVRMEELVALYASAAGKTNARDLGVGMTFKIDSVPAPSDDDNGEYLMVAALYILDFAGHEAIEDLKETRRREGFRCDFIAMSTKQPAMPTYRSARITPRPVIAGPQTAFVVGASSNEIETDIHGRVKIHFHWDRTGKKDQTSSCWVRVAQPWAGKEFGAWSLPRVGQEVVVQFLDGDPDRPLITGSVYNKDNPVAWKLPEQATVTGFKSRTSEKGDKATANELRFDDKKDKEYIWFHAERDFHRQVEHDAFDWVGNNESVKVTLTRKEVIGENWFMDVTKDVMHNLGKDLHVNVAGDIFYTGKATMQLMLTKDFSAKVDGDLGAEVGGKTQIKSTGDITIESTGKITLKGASIVLQGSGPVDIVGAMVKVNSGGSGSPAQPAKPTEAKKEESTTPAKKTDYDKTFDDPLPDSDGGTGPNKAKAS
jgi:type VI secretion system secreted protein VgrG